jgi:hypothetical protein
VSLFSTEIFKVTKRLENIFNFKKRKRGKKTAAAAACN